MGVIVTDSGSLIGLILAIGGLGFLLASMGIDVSARLTGIILLIFGISLLLFTYSPGTFIAILEHVSSNSQTVANVRFIFSQIQQEAVTAFATFLIGFGLGLVWVFPKVHGRRCPR